MKKTPNAQPPTASEALTHKDTTSAIYNDRLATESADRTQKFSVWQREKMNMTKRISDVCFSEILTFVQDY